MLHSKELASPKQTAIGKDISNPLIVDSLLKTIWLSMHHLRDEGATTAFEGVEAEPHSYFQLRSGGATSEGAEADQTILIMGKGFQGVEKKNVKGLHGKDPPPHPQYRGPKQNFSRAFNKENMKKRRDNAIEGTRPRRQDWGGPKAISLLTSQIPRNWKRTRSKKTRRIPCLRYGPSYPSPNWSFPEVAWHCDAKTKGDGPPMELPEVACDTKV
ncbi:hypothetical protein Tco_0849235 [Tanacetum coccineum]